MDHACKNSSSSSSSEDNRNFQGESKSMARISIAAGQVVLLTSNAVKRA
jgi:hypothetical protein